MSLALFTGMIFTPFINNKSDVNWKKIALNGIRGLLLVGGAAAGALYLEHQIRIYNQVLMMLFGIIGAVAPILAWSTFNRIRLDLRKENFRQSIIYSMLLIAMFLGYSISYLLASFDLLNSDFTVIALWAIAISSIALLALVSYHSFKSFTLLKKYRRSKPKLIKP